MKVGLSVYSMGAGGQEVLDQRNRTQECPTRGLVQGQGCTAFMSPVCWIRVCVWALCAILRTGLCERKHCPDGAQPALQARRTQMPPKWGRRTQSWVGVFVAEQQDLREECLESLGSSKPS